jgi:hypothetical protein
MIRRWSQENPAHIPMLMKKLVQSKEDTNRINIFINLAASYIVEVSAPNQMDSVAAYLREARQLNRRFHTLFIGNSIHFYSAIIHLKLFSPDKGEFNKALGCTLKTQAMVGVTNDPASAEEYYSRIGWIYRHLKNDQERHA